MHGLPPKFRASVFVGKNFELVSFSENTVHFQFEGRVSVTAQAAYFVKHGGKSREEKVPGQSSSAMALLGKIVRLADSQSNGTLNLTFGEGEALGFRDIPQYESYTLTIGDEEIFV